MSTFRPLPLLCLKILVSVPVKIFSYRKLSCHKNMDSENITNAITLRMKKTTRTAFWYQLNDLIEKIRLYKARFQSQSPSKTNKSIGKKLKKSFKRGFWTNKTLQTFRGPQNNNEFDSPDKTGRLNFGLFVLKSWRKLLLFVLLTLL